jgi:ubiquinone/menaquinone biosynthesis C-methylase UbiE
VNAISDLRVVGELEPSAAGLRNVSVSEGYNRWASTYDDDPNPLLAREERYLLPLLFDLHGKTVLDLACGTGRWLERSISQGAAFAVGIDSSLAMLHVATQKSAIRTRVAGANCESLPFPDATFDLAICSFALGHFQDLAAIVDELARVMKPEADVFVSDLHPEAHTHGWRVGFRYAGTPIHIQTQSRTIEEIRQAFCSEAFECQSQDALWLGQPERAIFDRAGKSGYFSEACSLPAVLFCHFRRANLIRTHAKSGVELSR